MVVQNIARMGQSNGTGNDTALFLKLFAGEVLTQFHRQNKFMGLTRTREISSGKSAQFPITGTATAAYHTPGDSVYGTDNGQTSTYLSAVKSKEREIFCDDPIVSGVFVPSIDELRTHYDARSVYAAEIASALAEQADYNILATLFAAVRTDADFNTAATGTLKQLTTWADATSGANLVSFCYAAAQKLDEFNVPKEDRYLAVRPKQYYLLSQQKDYIDRDYTAGNGDIANASIMQVAGLKIIVTNGMPTTQTAGTLGGTSGPVRNNPFGGTSGYTVANGTSAPWGWNGLGAIAFHKDAAGTVRLKDISVETERSIERQGNLILASYAMGHNILRPECAIGMMSTSI